jgi:hypothetical protein
MGVAAQGLGLVSGALVGTLGALEVHAAQGAARADFAPPVLLSSPVAGVAARQAQLLTPRMAGAPAPALLRARGGEPAAPRAARAAVELVPGLVLSLGPELAAGQSPAAVWQHLPSERREAREGLRPRGW